MFENLRLLKVQSSEHYGTVLPVVSVLITKGGVAKMEEANCFDSFRLCNKKPEVLRKSHSCDSLMPFVSSITYDKTEKFNWPTLFS